MSWLADFAGATGDVVGNSATYEVGLRFFAVLAFAATGEWVAEKSGTMNISIEAMMLGSAFGAAVGYDLTSSTGVGLVFAVFAGLIIAAIQANMSHRLLVNQFVVGLTLNVLVFALIAFLHSDINPVSKTTASANIPGLKDFPLIGKALFDQNWPFYLLPPLVLLAWWLLYKTRWGLEARAAGEDTSSSSAMGIPVLARRRQAVYFCGICAGLAGGYLVLGQIGRFENTIVGGQGYLVLAAVIFGGWSLRGALLGCALFGFANSLRLILPALDHPLNAELLSALPFALTIGMVALVAHHRGEKSRQPRALGSF